MSAAVTRSRIIILTSALALPSACKKAAAPAPARALPVSQAAAFTPPAGWASRESSRGPDTSLHLSSGPYEIRVQVLGGEGSAFPRPEDLLKALVAEGEVRPSRKARVAGFAASLFEASHTAETAAPGAPSAPAPVREEFCILSLSGGRFLVVGTEARGAHGGPEPALPPEWAAFLDSLSLKTAQSR